MVDLKNSVGDRLDKLIKRSSSSEFDPYISKNRKKTIFRFTVLGIVIFSLLITLFELQIARLERKHRKMRSAITQIRKRPFDASRCSDIRAIFPKLTNVPFADDQGIVIGTKSVPIRNIAHPFNASIIKNDPGYDLFFRYDVILNQPGPSPYCARIGVAHLNEQFEQTEKEFKKINVQDYAEDPRAITVNGELYLLYNAPDQDNWRCRTMYVANLNNHTFDVNYSTALDMNLQWIEKNWSPFEFETAEGKKHLFMEYQICPRKLLALPNPKVNEIENLKLPRETSNLVVHWADRWGQIRGGTPAKKIGDEYLGFFHSYFVESNGLICYIMGAYTFEASPPFHITGISRVPIIFKGIYDTPFASTADFNKCVIYPCGFEFDKKGGQDVIVLACGENDSGIKIVTLNKEKLLKSLIRFEKEELK